MYYLFLNIYLARESGFISRSTSRLSGEAFLKMLTTHIAPTETWSLNDQCHYLQEQFGIDITKQSLMDAITLLPSVF